MNKGSTLLLRKLSIQGFRAIDNLEINFPPPLMTHDPEITVIGSKNGIGKTTILEACSWLIMASVYNKTLNLQDLYERFEYPIDLSDLYIRGGYQEAHVTGEFEADGKAITVGITFNQSDIELHGEYDLIKKWFYARHGDKSLTRRALLERFIYSITGVNANPLVMSPFLYFHGYRKVQEGSIDLIALIDEESPAYRSYNPRKPKNSISTFKSEILRAMMASAKLIENLNNDESEETLKVLNQLLRTFAGGEIKGLRPTLHSTFEFRIMIHSTGETCSFDGLSSGQKEIISTLFLIWKHTKDTQGIVLIDEPELHLNAEWHRSFINQLFLLCPHNQYIIATHSEDVFASVDEDRRLLIAK
jgi:predicted ATP-binding protein involved in virulence